MIRPATIDDVPTILGFIRELAAYERLAHEVVADEAALRTTLFGARMCATAMSYVCWNYRSSSVTRRTSATDGLASLRPSSYRFM